MRMTQADYEKFTQRGTQPILPVRMTQAESAFVRAQGERATRGEVLWCQFRPCALDLGGSLYTPRFLVLEPEAAVFVEFDALHRLEYHLVERWRQAACRWPWHLWVLYRPTREGFEALEWLGGG